MTNNFNFKVYLIHQMAQMQDAKALDKAPASVNTAAVLPFLKWALGVSHPKYGANEAPGVPTETCILLSCGTADGICIIDTLLAKARREANMNPQQALRGVRSI